MAEYLVPKSAVVFEEEIKKSRFITYLQHTEGLEDARAFWVKIKQKHSNARHHCWAAVAGKPTDSLQLGFSDDGEPAGTAGKPMLSALQGSQLGEISAVVVRYYGGILLGTGGLVRAYGNGVQQALKLIEREIKVERTIFKLDCDYGQLNLVQQLCEKYQVEILSQDFQANIHLILGISEKTIEEFSSALTEKSSGRLVIQLLEIGK
ncbi:TPA: YigZ family protein [Haemophilus influenzae]|uniref:IMPACT family member YigZ n=1 Tax=Haemophilus influenzae TaxID=727 RepID=A0A2S9RMX2_HAEIF|nr:YigZ family protein [Haemophilus influenzae]AWP54325.1 YigZ family protein [Haemophilus influenzae]PRI37619.1 IMPACT family member YigZ [Haemophilus influenzae]PRI44446.1 IMPACT family member YigZ [Haemophilus influenzae]PRI85993.1 IMPACT family member YigZ [Haemophilus influenzae]PRI90563.1 IMPACT family member YigZ [Haemophilus influenzae]